MRIVRLTMTIVLIGSFTFGGVVLAQEIEEKGLFDEENFSATLAFTSDYLFRGVSQTDSKPAIQGSFDYAHPVGVYLGIWGSNVNSDISNGGVELDFYVGYSRELFTNFNADVGLFYYYYPGGGSDPEPDFFEGVLKLDYTFTELFLSPKLGVHYAYSPDYFGEDGNAHYIAGLLEFALPYKFVLSGEWGYQDVEGDKTTGDNQGLNGEDGFDYRHWRIGVSKDLLGFTLDLSYHDTDEAEFLGDDIADERLVFTASRSF